MAVKDKVKNAEELTNANPTEKQKEKGNYKKGKIQIKGLKISIENPVGTIRSGTDKDGNEWSNKMPFTYGYFRGTIGKDGDSIDVYIGPIVDEDFDIYVIDQVDEETRSFDEHKVMFGFEDEDSAKEAYLSCFNKGWTGFGKITSFSLKKFKKWIKNKDAIKYPASRINKEARMEENSKKEKLIKLYGAIEEDKTLDNLIEQTGDTTLFKTLVVEIASPGGSVSEGLRIMVWLNSLSESGIEVITVVSANAYSIASLIMLVANKRLISKHAKVMVHNPMIPELEYVNASQLEQYASELRKLETTMYELYQIFTGLDGERIKELMDSETYLSPQEAVDEGFADLVVDIKPKSYEMTNNNKKSVNMSKTLNILNRVISMVNKTEFVNQLYYDMGGEEIEIFQGDPATYGVGDRTSLKEGSVTLSDGAKLTIEESVITEIDKAIELVEVAEPTPEELEEIKAKKVAESLEAEVEAKKVAEAEALAKEEAKKAEATTVTQVSKWETEVVNDTFELLDKVEYVPFEGETEPMKVSAGEYELEDGRKVLVDSDGIIQFIKPAKEEAKPKEDAPKEEKPVEEKPKAEDFNIGEAPEVIALQSLVTEMTNKVEALENKSADMIVKMDSFNKFETVATEAIDVLANNTVSTFKPDAKVVEGDAKGSIFTQMKEKRGLK